MPRLKGIDYSRAEQIGELIKARRIAVGYNQAELEQLIGMHSGGRCLRDIEHGEQYLSSYYIRPIAQFLGLPVERLIP